MTDPLDSEVPEKVTRFLDSNMPKVYVALASTRLEYLRTVLEIVEDVDVRVVAVTTAHGEGPKPRGDVLLCDFLPSHYDVFSRRNESTLSCLQLGILSLPPRELRPGKNGGPA